MPYPNTGAPEWAASQASPWNSVNEAAFIFDAFASRSIIEDRDLTAPPVSCANGARYLIDAAATGLWATHDGELAIAVGANASNGWYFADVANHGNQLFVRDEDLLIEYDGGAWVTAPGGVSVLDDLTDVDAPAPGNGDALRFNSGSGEWQAVADPFALDTDGTLAANSDTRVASQKATKTYVDAKLAGLSWKQAVRVATTANATLASAFENGDTVDGVVLATGDRILIKNQSSGAENGIYIVAASGAPARATDADAGAELVNASVYVSEGTANADTQWTCSTNAPITVGSTSLTFAQLTSAGGALQASNNLSDVGNPATAGANIRPIESLIVACSDETTALTAGTNKVTVRMPYAFTVTAVRASLTTAQATNGAGGIFTVDINEGGSTILSTKLTIDNTEKTSTTAVAAAVISDASLADDAEITIDIDQIGDGTAKGLKVYLIGHRT